MMAMALIFNLWRKCEEGAGRGREAYKPFFPGLELQHWTFVLEIRAMPSWIEEGFPPCRKHSCFCLRKRLFTFLFHINFSSFLNLVTQRPIQHTELTCTRVHAGMHSCTYEGENISQKGSPTQQKETILFKAVLFPWDGYTLVLSVE